MNSELPFERGSTYFSGVSLSDASNPYSSVKHLLGRTFSVQNDGQAGIGHDPTETELMVVRNGLGASAGPNSDGTLDGSIGVEYGANGHEATALASAAGYGHVVDDAYVAGSIPRFDLFYVVVRGPVYLSSTDATLANGEKAGFGASGALATGASVTAHVIGVVHGDQDATAQSNLAVVNVGHPAGIGPLA